MHSIWHSLLTAATAYSDIIFRHSVWHQFWTSYLASFLLRIFIHTFCLAICLTFYSGILAGIYSISFWRCIAPFYLAFALACSLPYYPGIHLASNLTSSPRGALPKLNRKRQTWVGSAHVWRSPFKLGDAHCDSAFGSEVRQCPLRYGTRRWCAAVPTETWSS